MFHVSFLKPYHADPEDAERNRPAINSKRQPSKEAEERLAERVITVSRRPRREFLVKWRNPGNEDVDHLSGGECHRPILLHVV